MSKPTESTTRPASDVAPPRVRQARLARASAHPASATTSTRFSAAAKGVGTRLRAASSPLWMRDARRRVAGWQGKPRVGVALLLLGTAVVTLLVLAIDGLIAPLPNPGIIYLPLIAMLAYHWSWRLGALAGLLQLAAVYVLFVSPVGLAKSLDARGAAQLVTLAAVNVFTLLLVQLARAQRDSAARQASRAQAVNLVGRALTSELDEQRLLRLIAQTARDLTGADFAAFTLRPLDTHGRPLGPAEGSRFHLAAVVGVTPQQESLLRRMPLGGEGLLAPIFRHGVPVRVADALAMVGMAHSTLQTTHPLAAAPRADATQYAPADPAATTGHAPLASTPTPASGPASTLGHLSRRDTARAVAAEYARGARAAEDLDAVGSPRGHPVVRSFLGVPLLDREGQVRGGLLLGHSEPGRFTGEDEQLLTGLAAQAAVALENARLYRAAQTQAQELDAIFDSISDAVMLVDDEGQVIRENRAASTLALQGGVDAAIMERVARIAPAEAADATKTVPVGVERGDVAGGRDLEARTPSGAARSGRHGHTDIIRTTDAAGEEHQYAVTATPLRKGDTVRKQGKGEGKGESEGEGRTPAAAEAQTSAATGAVVVWHDLTEARRLLRERQARAEADARRALLQLVIDELPGGVYLVRGPHARLVLANQAARDVWGADWAEGQPMNGFLAERGVRILAPAGQPLAEDELATVRAVRTGEAVRHHQEIIRRPDGSAMPVLLNAVVLDPSVLPSIRASQSPERKEPEQTAAPKARDTSALRADDYEGHERAALVVLQDVTALKEDERVKDEFITIAAHELKTPMTAVKGYTDMLRRRSITAGDETGTRSQGEAPAAALAPWQRDALETIDQATDRLVELTEDLLDVARLQANRVTLHLEPHDLVALARRVAKRLQFSTERHTLTVESDAKYVVARLDVSRIEQVVGNLLSNAIKYTPDGGPITITVREDTTRGEAMLTVRDRGIGIPADQQGRLFARFARADNASAVGIGGTGLGLYLSRELVERHGGRIWFESAEGAGSAFSIALPLASSEGEDDEDSTAE